jgi:hypothetical protein
LPTEGPMDLTVFGRGEGRHGDNEAARRRDLPARQSTGNFYVNKINAGIRPCSSEGTLVKCAWSSLSLLR